MPGARCTRGLVCKMHKEMRTRAYRFSGGIRPSLRNGLRLIARSPGVRAFQPPSPALLIADLTPASRSQDHTPWPSAAIAPSSLAPPASTASRPAFRDDREPPLGWDGMAESIMLIWPRRQAKFRNSENGTGAVAERWPRREQDGGGYRSDLGWADGTVSTSESEAAVVSPGSQLSTALSLPGLTRQSIVF